MEQQMGRIAELPEIFSIARVRQIDGEHAENQRTADHCRFCAAGSPGYLFV